jgi:hypothetical protein
MDLDAVAVKLDLMKPLVTLPRRGMLEILDDLRLRSALEQVILIVVFPR